MSLFDRLSAALARPAGADLIAGDLDPDERAPDTEAAVLVPVTERDRPGLILTVRCPGLRTHAGQIAFPGGRIDPGEDAVAAALREAWEELAIDPGAVRVAGRLSPYRTVTGFRVTPVVATIPADLALVPREAEVADWFEAPLDHVLDPSARILHSAVFEGRERHYYEIPWNGRKIWGATAAMLVNLSRQLAWN